jgi:hypothetical protein
LNGRPSSPSWARARRRSTTCRCGWDGYGGDGDGPRRLVVQDQRRMPGEGYSQNPLKRESGGTPCHHPPGRKHDPLSRGVTSPPGWPSILGSFLTGRSGGGSLWTAAPLSGQPRRTRGSRPTPRSSR